MPENRIVIRRALVSVYDKTGLEDLARGLAAAGVEIVSTGTTAATIRGFGLDVTAVEDVTGFPEILGGRVKTLHPHIHAGLLADQNDADHLETVAGLGIETFQLVISNLYPFRQTVAAGASQSEAIEQIDIGGPSMVRASAKNHGSVAIVVEPGAYPAVLAAVAAGGFDLAERQALAARAFRHTASYDIAVAGWLGSAVTADDEGSGFPGWIGRDWERAAVLRYGENPHQQAALYVEPDGHGLAQADQLSGKEMSFNNYVDADAAYRAAYDFGLDSACVAIIKHANPCGIALGDRRGRCARQGPCLRPDQRVRRCHRHQYRGDVGPGRAAQGHLHRGHRRAVLRPGAAEKLAEKKNLRVLVCPPRALAEHIELRQISGGVLAQTADRIDADGDDPSNWTLATGEAADDATLADLAFAWRAVRAVKSNAILLAHDRASVGVGMGQVNRVDSARLAVTRAGDRAAGSVAASDAFFPFADGLEILLDAGCVRSSSPAARCATDCRSRRRSGPASPCTSPVPGTSPTDFGRRSGRGPELAGSQSAEDGLSPFRVFEPPVPGGRTRPTEARVNLVRTCVRNAHPSGDPVTNFVAPPPPPPMSSGGTAVKAGPIGWGAVALGVLGVLALILPWFKPRMTQVGRWRTEPGDQLSPVERVLLPDRRADRVDPGRVSCGSRPCEGKHNSRFAGVDATRSARCRSSRSCSAWSASFSGCCPSSS